MCGCADAECANLKMCKCANGGQCANEWMCGCADECANLKMCPDIYRDANGNAESKISYSLLIADSRQR